MNPKQLRHEIRAIVEPTLRRMGVDLVAVEWVTGRRPTLRLSVDAPGGVGVDGLARLTHRLSPLLDEADPIAGAYDLELSSPGIERPLQRLWDFQRFVGFRARIVLEEGLPRRRYTGRILGAADGSVRVEVDGVEHELAFEQVEKANLVLDLDEFERIGAMIWSLEGEPGDEVFVADGSVDASTAEAVGSMGAMAPRGSSSAAAEGPGPEEGRSR